MTHGMSQSLLILQENQTGVKYQENQMSDENVQRTGNLTDHNNPDEAIPSMRIYWTHTTMY